MKFSQLEAADRARRELKDAQEVYKALIGYKVIGLQINRGVGEHVECPTTIHLSNGHHGTGSLSSIGMPSALQDKLVEALQEWADERIKNAEAQLRALGVELAA